MTQATFSLSVSRALRVVTRLNTLASDLSAEIQRNVGSVSAQSQTEEQARKRRDENKSISALLDKYDLIQDAIADVRSRIYIQNVQSGAQAGMAKLETLNAKIKLQKAVAENFNSGIDFEDLPATPVTGDVYRHRESVFTVEKSQRDALKEQLRTLQANHNRLSDEINSLNAQKMEILLDDSLAKDVGIL